MEQKHIKLSDNVLIQCPEKGFALRRAKKCFKCDHYRGILKATVDGVFVENEEADAFQIVCGRPISRKLTQLTDD